MTLNVSVARGQSAPTNRGSPHVSPVHGMSAKAYGDVTGLSFVEW